MIGERYNGVETKWWVRNINGKHFRFQREFYSSNGRVIFRVWIWDFYGWKKIHTFK